MMLSLVQVVPSLILVAGLVNDLKSKKVRNWLVLSCAAAAVLFVVLHFGFGHLQSAALSAALAILLFIPFVLTKVLGAGDMKLFTAFALSVSPSVTVNVFLYSLVWGALLGLFRALVSGQLKQLIMNTFNIAILKNEKAKELHQIPYTAALLFGWLSYLSLSQYSGAQLW